jgi:hypothetical protein
VHIDAHTGLVSVEGDIRLTSPKTTLPVQFDTVTGSFYCTHNSLTSLEGAPRHVGESFHASRNALTSLVGGPVYVGNNYICESNKLINLEGCAQTVGRNLECFNNPIQSLIGAVTVGHDLVCVNTPLTDLSYLPDVNRKFWITYKPDLHLLKCVIMKGLLLAEAPVIVQEIMNKYVGKGKAHMLNCALELKQAGYVENAKW